VSLPKIKEIIVVEGKNDTFAIRKAVDADTIETNGSAIDEVILAQIQRAQKTRGVIVFTDPDYAGERIRKIISRAIPGVKHAFLTQEKAKGKRKIGIEHASSEDIRSALEKVRTIDVLEDVDVIEWEEYVELGFVGHSDSSQFRKQVAEQLCIGYANAKQFFRRLHALQVTREELYEAIQRCREEADDDG
jgi:ribonuclease M5